MRPQEMSICRRRRFKKIKVHRPNLEPAATPKLHTHKHNRTRGPTAERAPSTVYRAITGYQVCDWTSIGDNVIHILWPLSLRCFLHFHFGLLRFAKIYFFSVSTIVLCVLATILNHLWRHSFYLYSKHYVTMQRSISYLKFSLNACHSEIYDRVEHIWTWFLWLLLRANPMEYENISNIQFNLFYFDVLLIVISIELLICKQTSSSWIATDFKGHQFQILDSKGPNCYIYWNNSKLWQMWLDQFHSIRCACRYCELSQQTGKINDELENILPFVT